MKKTSILTALLLLLVTGSILNSCNNRTPRPKGLINEDKMISILVDVHIAEAVLLQEESKGGDADSLSAYIYAKLFHKHEVNRATFESSLNYYMSDPKRMNEMYEQVFNRVSSMQGEVQALPEESYE